MLSHFQGIKGEYDWLPMYSLDNCDSNCRLKFFAQLAERQLLFQESA